MSTIRHFQTALGAQATHEIVEMAIHRRGPWRLFEAVEHATLEWVDWCNHRRLLEPIGNIPALLTSQERNIALASILRDEELASARRALERFSIILDHSRTM